jgi:hypothetical protein
MTQPHCMCCGKPAPKVTTSVFYKESDQPKDKADAQRRTNAIITSVKRDGKDGPVWTANAWDGRTYAWPFCTNACAILFALRAFDAGARVPLKPRDGRAVFNRNTEFTEGRS